MSDLISRCELFNRLAPVQTLGEAYGIIQGMETVDAVPVVHGFWINIMEGNAFRRKCSVCGEVFIGNSDKHDFCGCCGADMRKDGEHDTGRTEQAAC